MGAHYQALAGARVFADAWRWSQRDINERLASLKEGIDRLLPAYETLQTSSSELAEIPGFQKRVLANALSLSAEMYTRSSPTALLSQIRTDLDDLAEQAAAERTDALEGPDPSSTSSMS